MKFEEKLERYAKLLIEFGLNVQRGQDVYITADAIHRDFVVKLVRAAYLRGARIVSVDLVDQRFVRSRILDSKEDAFLEYVPNFIPERAEGIMRERAANLRLIGEEDPDILSDLDPKKMQALQFSYKRSLKKYYEEGIGHSKVQWTVASAATPGWGKKVFPELDAEAACKALWEQIFHICRVDHGNCIELWQAHDKRLRERAHYLTELKIKTLHFQGPGTDLKVGLSPKAIWRGGTDDKSPRGVRFEANIPTEECFTTPDFRETSGFVRTTRPFLINGKQIRGLELVFKEGKIVDFKAREGADTFAAYIASDEGANRLGEVALVGIDSPIFQSGKIFEEILFDENAACHVAIGFAYRFCIEGSQGQSNEQLAQIGCNTSSVHTDMMLSSEKVDVFAETYGGKKVALIEKGEWKLK